MQPFYDYIEKAIRWAQKESGVESLYDFRLVLGVNTVPRERILGIPVLVVPDKVMQYDFYLANAWDIDNARIKMLEKVLEYQELYPYEEAHQ
jgi:hypothetical protein